MRKSKAGRKSRTIPLAALIEVQNGASLRETAKRYGLGLATVWADCRRHGIKSSRALGFPRSEIENQGAVRAISP